MIENKILDRNTLKTILGKKRSTNKVVFTNGCFDILHYGHVKYLEDAKMNGSLLVVGVNSDSSVKKLKGSERPLNDQVNRARIIAALESVDYVTIFDEDTPYELIRSVMPDVLVKGGDWKIENIVGGDIVSKNGGRVLSIPFVQGLSTTDLINKIKKSA